MHHKLAHTHTHTHFDGARLAAQATCRPAHSGRSAPSAPHVRHTRQTHSARHPYCNPGRGTLGPYTQHPIGVLGLLAALTNPAPTPLPCLPVSLSARARARAYAHAHAYAYTAAAAAYARTMPCYCRLVSAHNAVRLIHPPWTISHYLWYFA